MPLQPLIYGVRLRRRTKEPNNMYQFLVVLATIATFTTSVSIKISPDELQVIWETVENDTRIRQQEAEQEILNLYEALHGLVEDAKDTLNTTIEEAHKAYQEELETIEAEALANGRNISRCLELADVVLQDLDAEINESSYQTYEALEKEADDALNQALQMTGDALEELETFKEKVVTCSDVDCASDLDVEVVEFYEKIVKDLDDALTLAEEAVLVKLSNALQNGAASIDIYNEQVQKLINDVKSCAE